jgi:hypothetical protein
MLLVVYRTEYPYTLTASFSLAWPGHSLLLNTAVLFVGRVYIVLIAHDQPADTAVVYG